MIRVIHDYLKKKRIKAILFKKTLQSSINVLLIDFIDINDHYCSLLLGYTETQIFTQSSQFLLGNSSGLFDELDNNLKIFSNQEEWSKEKYQMLSARELQRSYELMQNSLNKFIDTKVGDYCVNNLRAFLAPVASISLLYSQAGKIQKPIIFVFGEKVFIEEDKYSEDFFVLLEELGLSDLYRRN